ncbi:MAG TPA: PLP-dependent aminotransferase family protein [Jatrophihabitans sp.]|jgi:DNA-binding transcriptional MocR family regulator
MQTAGHVGAGAVRQLLPDLAEQPGPRYRALSSALAGLLLDGRLGSGVRLPSERDLAATLKISRATATAAYDELAADGLLIRKRGAGSYLILPSGATVSGPGGRIARTGRRPGLLDLSVASLPAIPGVIENAMQAVSADLSRFTGQDGYHPYGLADLRARIAERYTQRGVATTAEDILVTNGAQHSFDLILRLATNPGDRVLTELPTYPGAVEAIKAHQARAVAVPFAADGGWDTATIANLLRQTAPRIAYLIPDFHNPTGRLIDTESRRAVVSAARRSGTVVVVDESFVDLDLRSAGESGRAILPTAALDRTVISLGSLSKPLWGGLRIGWIRADPDTVQRLAVVRARSDMAGSVIDQLVAQHVLPGIDDLIGQRRVELATKRDALLAALADALPSWRPSRADGGLSIWLELDAPGATALTHLLEQRGVLLTPGPRFALDGTLERFLRFPFALAVEDLVRAVGLTAQAWTEIDRTSIGRSAGSLITA